MSGQPAEKRGERVLTFALHLAAAVFSLPMLAGCERVTSPVHGMAVTRPEFGRDFALFDPAGQLRHLADYRGKVVVIFFGYTQCPDVCPTTLTTMAEVMQQLGEDSRRVQVLFITLDPQRDTRPLLATYVPHFHPSFVGLSGDAATTAAVAREFRVFYQQRPGSTADSYSIDHSTSSYLYDPQGRLRLVEKYGTAASQLVADIRWLLAGS